MSRIARPRQRTPTETAAVEESEPVPELAALGLEEKTSTAQTRSTRVVYDVDATAAELRSEKKCPSPTLPSSPSRMVRHALRDSSPAP